MAKFVHNKGKTSGRSGRSNDRSSRPARRNDFQRTKVTCSSCGTQCEVPFKPTSNKPVFCDECFSKEPKQSKGGISEQDLDIINEKLNKIMKALKIE